MKFFQFSSSIRRQGFAFAMTDVLAMTVVYLFSKVVLGDLPFPVFGIFWFSAGLIWNVILGKMVPNTYSSFNFQPSYLLFLALVGLLDMSSTLMWFQAVDDTPNPAMVSFMTNISPVYALLLGWIFLRERMSLSEIAGIAITLSGALLIGYQSDFSLNGFLFSGAGLILISSLISQVGKTILKTKIKDYHAIVLSLNRIVFLLSFSILLTIYEGYSLDIGWKKIMLIAAGALLGPVLSAYAGYNALARLKVATYSILSTTRSFFVMIGAYFVLSQTPGDLQIAGGLLTVAGVFVMTMAKIK